MFNIDSFTLNKVAGAVLGSLLLAFGLHTLGHGIFETETPEQPGMAVEVADSGGEGGSQPEKAAEQPIAVLLAKADPAKGEKDSKACQACHSFEKGGPNKVGPNLWGVVDRPIASHEGFEYDDALKSKSDQKWTYENLAHFIKKPKDFAPGTKMTYGGMSSEEKRADLIAWLRTLADNPVPLPEVPAEGAAAPAASGSDQAASEAGSGQQASSEAGSGQTAEAASGGSLGKMLAAGDADKGQKVARACMACHSFDKGGPNKVGPNLWDVVDRPIASHEGFNYDDALKSKSSENWTFGNLDHFLTNPKDFAPGTKMTFAGVKDDAKRADLLVYLRSLSDDPKPLPAE